MAGKATKRVHDRSLRDSEIIDIVYADNFSDIPSDCELGLSDVESDSGSEFDYDISRKRKRPRVLDISSDSESDSDNCSPTRVEIIRSVGIDTSDGFCKDDPARKIEPFEGVRGLTCAPNNNLSVPEAVELFCDNELFSLFVEQSNLYRNQNADKYKTSPKSLKWNDITVKEMKKFISAIILMGQVKKDRIRDYWSTNPLIETPIFGKLMSRNRWEQIWNFWHFSDNLLVQNTDDRLYKVRPVLQHLTQRFQTVYKPAQELSLDEAMIPWRGRLRIRTYNPGKLIKYGILVRMVSEATTGYICNMKIYAAEGKKLEDTIFSVLEPNLDLWHHVYQDNYYNSVAIAEHLLQRKTRVCGTIRSNRGLPKSFVEAGNKLKAGQSIFCRRNDVLLQTWKDKREVRMVSTLHQATIERKERKRGGSVKKPSCILEYNKYMKGVDRADQYLSYYSILRKTMKWSKKVVLWLLNCALFNAFRVYKYHNPDSKLSYKNFLLETAKYWAAINANTDETAEEEEEGPEKSTTPRAPYQDPPGRLLGGDVKKHKLQAIVTGNKKYPSKPCRVCAAHKKRKETRYICSFCTVPLHKGECFERYHTLKHY